MQAHLQAFDYGNADVSGELTTFWLGGPGSSLQIDGHQQLKFLRRLFAGALEVDPGHLHTVQSAMVRTPASLVARMPKDYRLPSASPDNPPKLWVKTGTAALRNQGSVTWLVGQVERDGRRFVFVSRVVDPNTPPRVVSPAVTHGLDALAQLGLMG
jgi:beta-lactamase class D